MILLGSLVATGSFLRRLFQMRRSAGQPPWQRTGTTPAPQCLSRVRVASAPSVGLAKRDAESIGDLVMAYVGLR